MKKGMKSKGYAKGGAKMMKAMGGRMMAKGYSKGGAKMMKASRGTATFMKDSDKQSQIASNQASFTRAKYLKALENVGKGNRLTSADVSKAARMLMKKK